MYKSHISSRPSMLGSLKPQPSIGNHTWGGRYKCWWSSTPPFINTDRSLCSLCITLHQCYQTHLCRKIFPSLGKWSLGSSRLPQDGKDVCKPLTWQWESSLVTILPKLHSQDRVWLGLSRWSKVSIQLTFFATQSPRECWVIVRHWECNAVWPQERAVDGSNHQSKSSPETRHGWKYLFFFFVVLEMIMVLDSEEHMVGYPATHDNYTGIGAMFNVSTYFTNAVLANGYAFSKTLKSVCGPCVLQPPS